MKFKSSILKQIFFLFVLLSLLVLPYFVFAQENTNSNTTNANNNNPLNRLENVASGEQGAYAEANEFTFSMIIGQVVRMLLSFLGIIFVVLIIVAGFQWMTANGNQESISKAKGSLQSSIIGLIIVVSAYAVWEFISSQLL
jgi:uncharacterized membrane protein